MTIVVFLRPALRLIGRGAQGVFVKRARRDLFAIAGKPSVCASAA